MQCNFVQSSSNKPQISFQNLGTVPLKASTARSLVHWTAGTVSTRTPEQIDERSLTLKTCLCLTTHNLQRLQDEITHYC
jgi:hypothetical protein